MEPYSAPKALKMTYPLNYDLGAKLHYRNMLNFILVWGPDDVILLIKWMAEFKGEL